MSLFSSQPSAKATSAKKKKTSRPSTQKYLPIREVREDCVVLTDGTLRSVILVSSINFALKGEDEQNAVISAYVSFLNSLDFPLEIVVQSRKLNIDKYLDRLKKLERDQVNELLRLQTTEYISYVKELIKLADIMSKRFYVVVPYDPSRSQAKGFWVRLQELFTPQTALTLNRKRFLERKEQLMKRVDFVASALASVGLQAVVLDSQSLIELYYTTYNPELTQQEPVVDVDKIDVLESKYGSSA